MVMPVSSLGRNGIHDYILTRATAIVMAFYVLYIVTYFVFTPEVTYANWLSFWAQVNTKVFTMLALFCVLIHAWIGIWQVLTDYVKQTWLRGSLQFAVIVISVWYLLSGFFILWGV